MRSVLPDLRPWQASAGFRRLCAAITLSQTGDQLTAIAIAFQVYQQTGSTLHVGAVSLAAFVPLTVGSAIGGDLSDRSHGRAVITAAFAVHALITGALALDSLGGPTPLAVLYGYSACAGLLTGLEETVCGARVSRLLPAQLRPAGNAMVQFGLQLAIIAGPALAGLLLGAGKALIFLLDAASFVISLVLIAPRSTMSDAVARTGKDLEPQTTSGVLAGIRILSLHPVMRAVFIADLLAMIAGLPRAAFPAIVDTRFGGSTVVLGGLYASVGAGALIATVTSGWLSVLRRQGACVLAAVAAWGFAIAAFALANTPALAVAALMAAGYADIISSIMRSTVLQNAAPPAMLGRLSGMSTVVVNGGPRLGDVETGLAVAAFGTAAGVFLGGVACVAGVAVLAIRSAPFRTYSPSPPERG